LTGEEKDSSGEGESERENSVFWGGLGTRREGSREKKKSIEQAKEEKEKKKKGKPLRKVKNQSSRKNIDTDNKAAARGEKKKASSNFAKEGGEGKEDSKKKIEGVL